MGTGQESISLFFMHVPFAHRMGVSTEQPDSAGHFVDMEIHEPSGHLRSFIGQDKSLLLQLLSFSTHSPLGHLYGLFQGHPLSFSQ